MPMPRAGPGSEGPAATTTESRVPVGSDLRPHRASSMPNTTTQTATHGDLRSRATSRLNSGPHSHQGEKHAFGVLHELASSPSTASDALALLHELQVHQIELELQAEEMRGSRTELEAALRRQIQLYDCAPVGYFTLDLGGTVRELNLSGAALLGRERDLLVGQAFDSWLAPRSARALRAELKSVGEGHCGQACVLQLNRHEGDTRTVYATASADPAGGAFLVTLMDAGPGEPVRQAQ